MNEFLLVEATKPPKLGSDAEDINFTKIISPLASKSFVLANPENYEFFLSRFNSFSYIGAFNTFDDEFLDDDNVIYLFLLPDVMRKLTSDVDYFNLPENEFTLEKFEKDSILRSINESGQQMVSTKVRFIDPIVTRYSLSIVLRYFDDFEGREDEIKDEIRARLNEYFLTVRRRDKIPKSDIIAIIEGINGVDSVNVFFTSERNEEAIRNGFYIKKIFI